MALFSVRVKYSIYATLLLLTLISLQWQWRKHAADQVGFAIHTYTFKKPHQKVDTTAQIRLWRALEHLLSNNAPGIQKAEITGRVPEVKYEPRPFEFGEMMKMSDEDVASMKRGHEGFVKGLSVHQMEPVYNKGTRGIVCSAGGVFLPLVVITLRMLQRLGSTLPMEVFLESGSEYESYICEEIFPALNARCVILGEILNTAPHQQQIGRFQLKIFSILFSSFEEVLYLDADSLPLQNPMKLFNSELFKTKGMILWPDYWYQSQAKQYFEIAGIKSDGNADRASTESGQLLLSKKTHWQTLLLCAYYNYWGPDHYYPLLAQGGDGEGDKETFAPAALVAGEPFYQVSEKVKAVGSADLGDNDMYGIAMMQFDPVEDHHLTSQGIFRTKTPYVAASPKPFFLHANMVKFNPRVIYDNTNVIRWPNGTYRRAWTKPAAAMAMIDFDVERAFFEEAKWSACNLMHRFRDWFGRDDICRKAHEHWDAVYGDSEDQE